MKALFLRKIQPIGPDSRPLELLETPMPEPGPGEVLIRVSACGICHTELDEIEGRLPPLFLPIIPGHQVVGQVVSCGENATRFGAGDRVGIGWFRDSCGACPFCTGGLENLCSRFQATGRDGHGGYAEYMKSPEKSVFPMPDSFSDLDAAPLLCAGAIGYRSLKLSGISEGGCLGLTGFGASGHLVLRLVRKIQPGTRVFVFARRGQERRFAIESGAVWAGGTLDPSPEKLDAVVDTTPVWAPPLAALKNLKAGGRLVINAIRKEETDKESLLGIDYPAQLWMEKEIKTVANVAPSDIAEFLSIAAEMSIHPEVRAYALDQANLALVELKAGRIRGAKVLRMV